ncbi:MAG: hypothetical protein LUD25_05115, partial [Coriobacteriaceae bacterium]|nr:hypothetical protein [Coriobacteriaceae bacterium]
MPGYSISMPRRVARRARIMSLISRKEFLDKLALVAFVPLADEEYKKPEIISWKLETLNSAESYAKSFENMDYYDHTLNSLPSVDDLDRYNHIFTAAHGIEDAETWAPQIESMVKSKSCYAGECLRGKSGTSEQHMLLGYQKNIDDNQQLWAYVEKVNHLVQTAGINE